MNKKVVYLKDIIEKFINGPSHLDKDQIIYLINRIPSFDRTFDRPRGEWIGDKCSICGTERAWYGDTPDFCPDCGADMRGEDEE